MATRTQTEAAIQICVFYGVFASSIEGSELSLRNSFSNPKKSRSELLAWAGTHSDTCTAHLYGGSPNHVNS